MAEQISVKSVKRFGQILRQHRKEAGLSRIQLAEIAGLGKTVIYDVEHGKPTVRLDTLMKLFDVLNIKITIDSPLIQSMEKRGHEKS
jgi:y4mF family transcriptional regulator